MNNKAQVHGTPVGPGAVIIGIIAPILLWDQFGPLVLLAVPFTIAIALIAAFGFTVARFKLYEKLGADVHWPETWPWESSKTNLGED